MQIVMASGGIASTNCYLLADEDAKQAVIVDAPDHTVQNLLKHARDKGWEIIALWLTHGHFDHVADHKVVTDAYPSAKVFLHKLDQPKLQNPGSSMFTLPFTIPPRDADELIDDGSVLTVGRYQFKAIHTPGHSPGHVCLYCESEKLLLGGDLIICSAVGRTDLPDSNPSELDKSIRKIMKLPGDTNLLPGHCDVSTLSHELQTNPYVRIAVEYQGPASE